MRRPQGQKLCSSATWSLLITGTPHLRPLLSAESMLLGFAPPHPLHRTRSPHLAYQGLRTASPGCQAPSGMWGGDHSDTRQARSGGLAGGLPDRKAWIPNKSWARGSAARRAPEGEKRAAPGSRASLWPAGLLTGPRQAPGHLQSPRGREDPGRTASR